METIKKPLEGAEIIKKVSANEPYLILIKQIHKLTKRLESIEAVLEDYGIKKFDSH